MKFRLACLLLFLLSCSPCFAAPDSLTFNADIAPLLKKRCASCHISGGPAPFPLISYADAQRRASQLVQVTQSGYMPPWKTTSPHFHGERALTADEKATLKKWAESGSPEGKREDAISPSSPTVPPTQWPLGPPDRVLSMPQAYTLSAATSEVFRCFVIPAGLTEDRWVRAVAFRPAAPRAVRYVALYIDASGQGKREQAISGGVGYDGFASGLRPLPEGSVAEWSPGAAQISLTDNVAFRLPKGADLILQLRFHPTGKPEKEQMQIGLYFVDVPPVVAPVTLRLGAAELYLPRQSTATLTDSFTLPADVTAFEITPNFHPVTRTIVVIAETPDGKTLDLLQISDNDANWKQSYRYQVPPRLPAGTRLTLKATFDNTEANPRNLWKPSHRVVPGLEFMEEMSSVTIRLLAANADDEIKLRAALPPPAHNPVLDIQELEPEGSAARRPRPGPKVRP